MTPDELSDELMRQAWLVRDLEEKKAQTIRELDGEIQQARARHVSLLTQGLAGASPAPPPKQAAAAAQVATDDRGVPTGASGSARQRILAFVAQNGPVDPDKVEVELSWLGAKTVKQAIYDMISVKSGLLERGPEGVSLSKKGREAWAAARERLEVAAE